MTGSRTYLGCQTLVDPSVLDPLVGFLLSNIMSGPKVLSQAPIFATSHMSLSLSSYLVAAHRIDSLLQ